METKPISQSVTLWAALAMLLAGLFKQFGIEVDSSTIAATIAGLVQIGGAVIVIWRRFSNPKPLRGWK